MCSIFAVQTVAEQRLCVASAVGQGNGCGSLKYGILSKRYVHMVQYVYVCGILFAVNFDPEVEDKVNLTPEETAKRQEWERLVASYFRQIMMAMYSPVHTCI